ncbi:MAG: 30S ribosomal protein S13 [Candidatus Aenigmatarchaeota archaeon]
MAEIPKKKEGAPPAPKEKAQRAESIIRMVETNLDGNKPVRTGIRRVKGVSFMFSNAIAKVCEFADKKIADLTDAEQKKLEDMLVNPDKYGIPVWMYNRKREPVTNQNKHLIVSNLDFAQKMDINEMKKIKCYRGVRHAIGLPVRGQRTRGSFRTGKTVGVARKKARQT